MFNTNLAVAERIGLMIGMIAIPIATTAGIAGRGLGFLVVVAKLFGVQIDGVDQNL